MHPVGSCYKDKKRLKIVDCDTDSDLICFEVYHRKNDSSHAVLLDCHITETYSLTSHI